MTKSDDSKRVLIHIGPNTYPPLPTQHHTGHIWSELAKGFDEYHVLARSQSNHFSSTRMGNMVLHLVPRLTQRSKGFFFTSFYLLVLARRHRATHLLCQCPVLGGIAAIVVKKLWGIPVMMEIHGDFYFRYMRRGGWRYALPGWLTRLALRNATKIRSLSSAMTAELDDLGLGDRTVLIPNRVNTRLFDRPKSSFVLGQPVALLGIGRFVEEKGFDIAIRALRLLRERVDARLVLVGGGALRERLTAMAEGLPVELVDWVDQTTLRDWMQQADVYVQPSKSEGMPRTILEAMAMRLPIVSTPVGAIPGVLHDGENALLVAPGDAAALAAAVLRLLDDAALRRRLAEQAYADVLQHYEWDHVFERYRTHLLEMS